MQAADVVTPQFKTELKAALDVPTVGLDLIQQLFATYEDILLRETVLKALEFKQIEIPLIPIIEPALHGSPEVTSIIGNSDKSATNKLALLKKELKKRRKGAKIVRVRRASASGSDESGSDTGSLSKSESESDSSSGSEDSRGSDAEVQAMKEARNIRKAERKLKKKLYPKVNNPPPRSVLANDLARLLQLDSLFDLTITTTDGGQFKAHQVIVFLRSSYFSPLIEVARASQKIADQSSSLSPMVTVAAPPLLTATDVRTYIHFLYKAEVTDELKAYPTVDDLIHLAEVCAALQCDALSAIVSLEMQDRLAGQHQEVCATIPKLDNTIKKCQQEKQDTSHLVNMFNRCLLWILDLHKQAGLLAPLDLKVIGAQRLDTLIKLVAAPPKDRPKFTAVNYPSVHVTLAKEIAAVYPEHRFADCVLVVGGTEFKAHRCLLSARSGYFEGAFKSSAYKEAVQGRIEIADLNSTVFASMLKYFYTSIPAATQSREELFEMFMSYDYFAPQSNELPRLILSMLNETIKKKLSGIVVKAPPPMGFYVGAPPKTIDEAVRRKICTYVVTTNTHKPQYLGHCNNCNLVGELVLCKSCIEICHKGHSTIGATYRTGFCDCGIKCKVRTSKTLAI